MLVGGPANAALVVPSMDSGSGGGHGTCTTLVTNPVSSVAQGSQVTLTAMVTPATAAGKMQFKDGAKNLGAAVPVTNGTAELKTTLDVGTHSLTAVFTSTKRSFRSSTSPTVPLTVTAGAAQTTTPQQVMQPPVQVLQPPVQVMQPPAQVMQPPVVQQPTVVVMENDQGLLTNVLNNLI